MSDWNCKMDCHPLRDVLAAGLAPAAPGYRRLTIQPRPGGNLTHARATLRTPYGLAESAWVIEQGKLTLKVIIPPNTTASVTLPGSAETAVEVGSGTYAWSYPYGQAEAPAEPT
ncbi:MAG TPA: alpha-L-rhamnosidase C-terminal domain-containing protein [Ktedonobacteraceae bacterium]